MCCNKNRCFLMNILCFKVLKNKAMQQLFVLECFLKGCVFYGKHPTDMGEFCLSELRCLWFPKFYFISHQQSLIF